MTARLERMNLDRIVPILNILAVTMIIISLLVNFFYAPTETTMGNVQRIFYFHVGAAWVAAVGFFVALISGIAYLRKPANIWDTIAVASVEIGLVFTSMTIVSGSVWGRPAWNTWWIWSPRLTSITVLWLVYVAYFMLRGAVEDEDKRGRFAAVYVVAAFVTVIITFFSIRLLRDIHPVLFGEASEAAQGLQKFDGLASTKMVISLNISVLTFTVLFLAWLANRLRLQRLVDKVTDLKSQFMARYQG
ncbi:MAG: cytochrome c biogenesis protein CcsA [Anaerolineae bacterium]|nr:MAG: cytochrome c biogenesis protein CcsA [Anaerolineae bacterium]